MLLIFNKQNFNVKLLGILSDDTNEEEVFCGSCRDGHIKTKATHFCITCDIPEPLCEDCA